MAVLAVRTKNARIKPSKSLRASFVLAPGSKVNDSSPTNGATGKSSIANVEL